MGFVVMNMRKEVNMNLMQIEYMADDMTWRAGDR